jgi:hypothetical protein
MQVFAVPGQWKLLAIRKENTLNIFTFALFPFGIA